jgi:hypothetical protein
MNSNFVKTVIDAGGSIHPIIIPASETNGTGLMNPSIYNDNGRLIMNLTSCKLHIISRIDEVSNYL